MECARPSGFAGTDEGVRPYTSEDRTAEGGSPHIYLFESTKSTLLA